MLVGKAIRGEIPLDHFITHRFAGVAGTTKALEALADLARGGVLRDVGYKVAVVAVEVRTDSV